MSEASPIHIRGIGVSPGIAIGPAVVLQPKPVVTPMTEIRAENAEAEWARFTDAVALTRKQIEALRERLPDSPGGESLIIDSHLMVLDDEIFLGDVHAEIFDSLKNAAWAVRAVTSKYAGKLSVADSEMLRERADDILDVGRRIHSCLLGTEADSASQIKEGGIVVASRITPSEALALPREKVRAIALDTGSVTSHAALVIRAIGIPAVFGLKTASASAKSGQTIAVDGSRGVVIINPDAAESGELSDFAAQRQGILDAFSKHRDEPAVTPDGFRVKLLANIDNTGDISALDTHGAEGIGLFRTEYLWLSGGSSVGEERQYKVYRTAAELSGGRPVVIRAFDLGGDKATLSSGFFKNEANPFLGLRSIRFLLKNPNIFKSQLRAVIRAGRFGDLRILIPMVSVQDEIIQAKEILAECYEQVRNEGCECKMPRLGAMIEVPSAAIQAATLAKHVDFFSIGSNDLVQYTMAADRINEDVAHLYQPANPAVLTLLKMTADAAREAGIPICICGEMASNPVFATLLLGMRIDAFSMAASSIPVIKAAIRHIPLSAAEELTKTAVTMADARSIINICKLFLTEYAPDVLKI